MRHSPLLDTIENQRFGCELAGSPAYARVLSAVGRDVANTGACARILGPYEAAPFGDAVLLRLLAGVHQIVLEGRGSDLAAHYPSAGGRPGRGIEAAFLAVVAREEPELVEAMKRGVQTNEVGRSAALLCGYLEVADRGLPMRILEVGASAGLNLWFDRYRYEAGGTAFGPAGSPLRFDEPFFGPPPDLNRPIDIVERRGSDLDPIDPTTEAGRLRLRSLIWPDQPERRARLDAALEAVGNEAPVVERADAVAWLQELLARPVSGVVTLVVHSIVFQYLSPTARREFLAVIDAAGSRATLDAPLAWLRMEPGGDQAEIRLTTWPDGGSRLLARSSFHGPPVVPTRR
ncbi:MAG: DUF2332 domain-containing protein [Aquihabitans sp.]